MPPPPRISEKIINKFILDITRNHEKRGIEELLSLSKEFEESEKINRALKRKYGMRFNNNTETEQFIRKRRDRVFIKNV